MDIRLFRLIGDYQAAVRQAVKLMAASGIARPASADAWVSLDLAQHGELPGGALYFKHGYGCAVHLPEVAVDFDFGAQGEIDGFDAGRLIGFAGKRLHEYGFAGENEVKALFDQAARSDSLRFSGYILYYLPASHQ